MDKLSSILDTVKERISSPLFGSYAISWLLWNWRVPVALFWFDSSQLRSTASWNYVDYISSILDFWSWVAPLLFAAGYTIALPFSRWVTAKVVKVGNDLVFKASKESKVSFENYYTVLLGNEEKAKRLEEMIGNQDKLRKKYDASLQDAVKYESTITARDNEIKTLKAEKREMIERNKKEIDDLAYKYETKIGTLDFELSNQQINNKDELERLRQSLDGTYRNQLKDIEREQNATKDLLQKRIDIATDKSASLRNELNRCKEKLDISIINGTWNKIITTDTDNTLKATISIVSDLFYEGDFGFKIIGFRKEGDQICFIVRKPEQETYVLFNTIENRLQGSVNGMGVMFFRAS